MVRTFGMAQPSAENAQHQAAELPDAEVPPLPDLPGEDTSRENYEPEDDAQTAPQSTPSDLHNEAPKSKEGLIPLPFGFYLSQPATPAENPAGKRHLAEGAASSSSATLERRMRQRWRRGTQQVSGSIGPDTKHSVESGRHSEQLQLGITKRVPSCARRGIGLCGKQGRQKRPQRSPN